MHWLLQITHVASSPVCALCHTELSAPFSRLIQPRSEGRTVNLMRPPFPTYRTPVPGYGIDICDLYYSEAPLEGITRAQICRDAGQCIGLLLQYRKHSQSVGNFRYDRQISEYLEYPLSIRLIRGDDNPASCVRIEFWEEGPDICETAEDYLWPMRGTIIWWYSSNMSRVIITLPEWKTEYTGNTAFCDAKLFMEGGAAQNHCVSAQAQV